MTSQMIPQYLQTGLPMTAMSVAGAQFRLPAADREILTRTFLPWAARAGSRSADLMCLYYEEHLEVTPSLHLEIGMMSNPKLPSCQSRKIMHCHAARSASIPSFQCSIECRHGSFRRIYVRRE